MAETSTNDSAINSPISLNDWESALGDEMQPGQQVNQGLSGPAPMESETQHQPLAAVFADIGNGQQTSESGGIDLVLEIPISISVELGSAKVPVKSMIQLGQGSVIELDGRAGDPLNIYANGALVAKGEVVIVNERFGIRLTQLVTAPRPKKGT